MSKDEMASQSGTIETSTTTTREDGSSCVSGGKDLKKTQAYPSLFGLRVAELHKEYMLRKSAEAVVVSSDDEADNESSSSASSDGSDGCIRDIKEMLAKACVPGQRID